MGIKEKEKLRYDETLMKMLLKGAAHFLYDDNNKIEILKVISDGNPYHRKINDDRVLWQLIFGDLSGTSSLQDYVTISRNTEIIQQSSQHKDYEVNTEEYINANILQLADMLLGGVIYSCYKGIKISSSTPSIGSEVENKKGIIAYPVKGMLDKRKRGKNFRYSGHYKSFTLSRASILNETWKFENIMTKEIEIVPQTNQLALLDIIAS